MPKNARIQFAIAALSVELVASAPKDFRIIPAGTFKSSDGSGRPVECGSWLMTDEDGARIVAEMTARKSARVIDYEHATLYAKKTGNKAPAAGWYQQLEWRSGDGLWVVNADWTAMAAQEIEGVHYRYVSPVFSYDPETGRVLELRHVALTNDPGLDGLTDLAALAAEFFSNPQPLEETVNEELLEQLRWLLNMPVGVTPDEVIAQLQKLIAQLKETSPVAANAAGFGIGEHIVSLAAQAASPDPAKFVPIATLTALQGENAGLQTKIAALQSEADGGKLDKVIADAKSSGKITPATEAWARDLGKTNLASLTAFLESAPVIVTPGGTQSGGSGQGGLAALSAEQVKVCELLGVSQEDFKETLSASA